MASIQIHVAVAVIVRNDEILIAQRPQHLHQGGLWEFPGGKVELDESVQDALVRELSEELDIEASHYTPLIRVQHDYDGRQVMLDVWRVTAFEGEPRGREGQQIRWVSLAGLKDYSFPAANRPILQALALPSYCLITPEPDDKRSFLQTLERVLQSGVHLLQLRAKTLSDAGYQSLTTEVIKLCRRYGARLLLNTSVDNYVTTDADGLHLTAQRLMTLSSRPVADDELLSAACHTAEEVAQANRLGVDLIFISPVQATLSHPGTPAIGWDGLHELCELASMPVYALGGMTLNDIEQAQSYGAQGIAAIRALWREE